MGFMDKAKKFAEQTQQQAKDGTLKEKAKSLAGQAQQKLDEVQTQFNERQQQGSTPAPETPAAETPAPAAAEAPAAPKPGPSGTPSGVDRDDEAPPKMTGGDPLAG